MELILFVKMYNAIPQFIIEKMGNKIENLYVKVNFSMMLNILKI